MNCVLPNSKIWLGLVQLKVITSMASGSAIVAIFSIDLTGDVEMHKSLGSSASAITSNLSNTIRKALISSL